MFDSLLRKFSTKSKSPSSTNNNVVERSKSVSSELNRNIIYQLSGNIAPQNNHHHRPVMIELGDLTNKPTPCSCNHFANMPTLILIPSQQIITENATDDHIYEEIPDEEKASKLAIFNQCYCSRNFENVNINSQQQQQQPLVINQSETTLYLSNCC